MCLARNAWGVAFKCRDIFSNIEESDSFQVLVKKSAVTGSSKGTFAVAGKVVRINNIKKAND